MPKASTRAPLQQQQRASQAASTAVSSQQPQLLPQTASTAASPPQQQAFVTAVQLSPPLQQQAVASQQQQQQLQAVLPEAVQSTPLQQLPVESLHPQQQVALPGAVQAAPWQQQQAFAFSGPLPVQPPQLLTDPEFLRRILLQDGNWYRIQSRTNQAAVFWWHSLTEETLSEETFMLLRQAGHEHYRSAQLVSFPAGPEHHRPINEQPEQLVSFPAGPEHRRPNSELPEQLMSEQGQSSTGELSSVGRRSEPLRHIRCHRCHQYGHLKKQCQATLAVTAPHREQSEEADRAQREWPQRDCQRPWTRYLGGA